MKHIKITKDTESLTRPGKQLKKGLTFECLDVTADQYIKNKVAKELRPGIQTIDEAKEKDFEEDINE